VNDFFLGCALIWPQRIERRKVSRPLPLHGEAPLVLRTSLPEDSMNCPKSSVATLTLPVAHRAGFLSFALFYADDTALANRWGQNAAANTTPTAARQPTAS